jgi:hypothetical protein
MRDVLGKVLKIRIVYEKLGLVNRLLECWNFMDFCWS